LRLAHLLDNKAKIPMSKRLILGWKKEKRDKHLKALSKHNDRLAKILKRTAESGAGYVPTRREAVDCLPHLGLRQKMSELRKAIGRAWCKCTGPHEMRFGLFKTWKQRDEVHLDMLMNLSEEVEKCHWGESKVSIQLKE
jgi:hypothetical protein